MTAVFYHTDEQKKLAEGSRDRLQKRLNSAIVTQIRPATRFYRAEDYHQKYRLRHDRELMKEFLRYYPNETDLVDSTAAARVNGYLYGYGTVADLEGEIDRFGLSPEAVTRLMNAVRSRRSGFRFLEGGRGERTFLQTQL